MALLALVHVLSGCAAPAVQPTPLAHLPQPRLAPQAMGVAINLEQRLTVERAPQGQPVATRHLDTLLEIDATSLRMAAFALGQRVLTLRWDGTHLTSQRHPMLPAEVDATYVLRDIEWMYAPLAPLRASLPPGWALHEVGRERTLSRASEPMLLIRHECASRWVGRSTLENRLEGYRLTLESAKPTEPC